MATGRSSQGLVSAVVAAASAATRAAQTLIRVLATEFNPKPGRVSQSLAQATVVTPNSTSRISQAVVLVCFGPKDPPNPLPSDEAFILRRDSVTNVVNEAMGYYQTVLSRLVDNGSLDLATITLDLNGHKLTNVT